MRSSALPPRPAENRAAWLGRRAAGHGANKLLAGQPLRASLAGAEGGPTVALSFDQSDSTAGASRFRLGTQSGAGDQDRTGTGAGYRLWRMHDLFRARRARRRDAEISRAAGWAGKEQRCGRFELGSVSTGCCELVEQSGAGGGCPGDLRRGGFRCRDCAAHRRFAAARRSNRRHELAARRDLAAEHASAGGGFIRRSAGAGCSSRRLDIAHLSGTGGSGLQLVCTGSDGGGPRDQAVVNARARPGSGKPGGGPRRPADQMDQPGAPSWGSPRPCCAGRGCSASSVRPAARSAPGGRLRDGIGLERILGEISDACAHHGEAGRLCAAGGLFRPAGWRGDRELRRATELTRDQGWSLTSPQLTPS